MGTIKITLIIITKTEGTRSPSRQWSNLRSAALRRAKRQWEHHWKRWRRMTILCALLQNTLNAPRCIQDHCHWVLFNAKIARYCPRLLHTCTAVHFQSFWGSFFLLYLAWVMEKWLMDRLVQAMVWHVFWWLLIWSKFKIQDYFIISSEKLKRGWTLTTSQYTITHTF